ncbi:threonine synthase [uncultured Helicobacter sp.]|uniref:threonine synthase n=1 Tax=uncultured Helicobacter sp. TaxID=175537 RepID=UPI003752101C
MIEMIQTRGKGEREDVCFADAVLHPSASFGGLYTFPTLPRFTPQMLEEFENLSYTELCKRVFGLLGLGLDEGLLDFALQTYEGFDESSAPAQLARYDENLSILELYHGPTRAFKDMALQPFGRIVQGLAQGREYLILVATSGDTGPATLESFARENLGQDCSIKVVCIYPKDGTSDVQRLQMVTQDSPNLKVLGIKGNFDDAQQMLKSLLRDSEFLGFLQGKGVALSVANSVNIGRVAFQIIYHIWAYCKLCKEDALTRMQPLHLIVPSGNFGNILGGFYAKKMGVPLGKLISASNANNILYDFITTGVYDIRHRQLRKTSSPAMDIIKSSNVERVLFELFGAQRTRECMRSLQDEGVYALDSVELEALQGYFAASFCEDRECKELIAKSFAKGYLLDPHTACGIKAYEEFAQSHKGEQFVLCSTAEWSKFAPTTAEALGARAGLGDEEAIRFVLSLDSARRLSPHIAEVFKKPVVHSEVVEIEGLKHAIMQWLDV